jgi:MFS family permease
VIPLSMTIVGELYALEERARTQALFSGVWGVASVIGPLVGGYITDTLSWRWVFLLNLPFGLLATLVIALAYPPRAVRADARVDWAGAGLLFSGVTALLIALGGVTDEIVPWIAATVLLLGLFAFVERRLPHPILPLDLLGDPVVSRSLVVVFMSGMAMFGAIAFVPLFVQTVLGGSATEAGQALTPLFLGWVTTSIAGARLTVRIGYRPVAVAGVALLLVGFVWLSRLDAGTTRIPLLASVFVLGCGMGLSMLSLLLAIQHGVPRSQLGLATSLNQFSRSIGATVGVALMGMILARSLAGTELSSAVEGLTAGTLRLDEAARAQLAAALDHVFAAGAVMSGVGLVAALFLPPVALSRQVRSATGEQMLASEMTMATDAEN